jgi:heptosyltransferase-2
MLAVGAMLYALIRGNARGVRPAQTFVIINPTGNIGDMVCTTPVFRAIKAHNPRARVVVVGAPKNAIMMEGNPDIDRYITQDGSMWNTIREIRKERADVGIAINPSTVDFTTFFFAGVKAISGFKMIEKYNHIPSRTYKLVSTLGHQVEYTPGNYVPRQYNALLRPFGYDSEDIQKHLAYTEEAKEAVVTQLESNGIQKGDTILAIAPGAGTKIKQWPAERFGAVANYVAKKYGIAIAIIGGPRDVDEVARMKASFDNRVRYCDFVSQPLPELKATLSLVTCILGNDSGPIYIAESFGAGTVVLVGPTDEAEHPLQDMTHCIVMAREKGESLLKSHLTGEDTIDLEAARNQIAAITVEQVCETIDEIFKVMKIEVLKQA